MDDDYLEELTKLKEQTQAEEEQLEISRGVDITPVEQYLAK